MGCCLNHSIRVIRRSGSEWSGDSKVRSPFVAKCISHFDLERRSLTNRLTGAVSHSKKRMLLSERSESFVLVEIEMLSELY